jgi:hypothetical protein
MNVGVERGGEASWPLVHFYFTATPYARPPHLPTLPPTLPHSTPSSQISSGSSTVSPASLHARMKVATPRRTESREPAAGESAGLRETEREARTGLMVMGLMGVG